MTDRPPQSPPGPGGPMVLLIVAGVIVGGLLGQPSIGLLAGLGLGILFAVALALRGRPRG